MLESRTISKAKNKKIHTHTHKPVSSNNKYVMKYNFTNNVMKSTDKTLSRAKARLKNTHSIFTYKNFRTDKAKL